MTSGSFNHDAVRPLSSTATASVPPQTRWWRLMLGLLVVYGIFQGTATALGSIRGEAGVLVGALVVLTTLGAEVVLFGTPPGVALRQLGLGSSAKRGLLAGVGVSLFLVLVIPIFVTARGTSISLYPGWTALLFGLFAQAGIAEEILFRGYLFRHVRQGRPFWRAAFLAAGPFVAVHSLLFWTLPWPVALAAVALAAIASFPLAYLFELSGGTIWAPALVHFVMQGAIKVVQVPGEVGAQLPLLWIAASATIPYLVFLMPRGSARGAPMIHPTMRR